ncbi:cytochrome c oxidase subunit 8A, mitochondrial-like [Cyprinodon tularosa]|uniref:cytochrome c oxidase subunit 8A, mitochondrial-like n=1 Tax=Cyprinodon tularosa TaxID=77115 RepID=UPI0018E24E98|nr:cytochrome c oxidase subunit 8A, mitochondrial-like [Cyprinodon tularosa]XP_038123291.1 cytochrome c oxidase subunit 8A, mitochondrial-like [Cyprinodon tularosa]
MSSILTRTTASRLLFIKSVQQSQRPTIYSKPPKERIGPAQSFFALCVFAMTLLAPAGWILHHIPEYRQGSAPQP